MIRRPQREDADRIAAVQVASWKETYTHLLPEGFFTAEHAQARRGMWARILSEQRDEWIIRVAESDGVIIGFAMAGPVQDALESPIPSARALYTLYVLRSHHGTGVGQALLDATIGSGSGSESEPVSLWVAKQNPRAISFYLRNGFRFDGREMQDPGVPAITDIRMVRP